MKFGARILKTGIAIVFALFLAKLFGLPNPVFAGIAAIFAIQPSIYRSYLTFIEQIQGNIIGATVAISFALMFGHQLVFVGLAAVVIILIMIQFDLEKSLSLALVTMIAIMEIQDDAFLEFALLRLATVVTGVLAASFINVAILPPRHETKLFETIHEMQDEIIRWTRLASRQASEHAATKKTLSRLEDSLKDAEDLYKLYREERSVFNRNDYEKARKLVVYRQILNASRSSIDVLRKLHLYENELVELPEHFRMMIQERLDMLLTYHEQLHLKFVGKLKSRKVHHQRQEDYMQRHEVMDIFIRTIEVTEEEEEGFSAYHLLHILSAILYYDEQLERLETLISVYHHHHKDTTMDELEETIY